MSVLATVVVLLFLSTKTTNASINNDFGVNKTERIKCDEPGQYGHHTSFLKSMTIPTISVLGLFGNGIAIISINYFPMKTAFHQSLVSLCTCDIMFITVVWIDQSWDLSKSIPVLFPYIWHPMRTILISLEAFLMISIATERFIAIKWPLQYKASFVSWSNRIHFLVFILPTILSAIIINIPKFLELRLLEPSNITASYWNFDIEVTDLRLSENYIYYYTHLTRLIITGILPMIYLTLINLLIFKMIRKMQKHRRLSVASEIDENELTSSVYGLFAIVALFIVCNIPRLVVNQMDWNLWKSVHERDDPCKFEKDATLLFLVIKISHVGLLLNSSANVFIYYSTGKMASVEWGKIRGFFLKLWRRKDQEGVTADAQMEETLIA